MNQILAELESAFLSLAEVQHSVEAGGADKEKSLVVT